MEIIYFLSTSQKNLYIHKKISQKINPHNLYSNLAYVHIWDVC